MPALFEKIKQVKRILSNRFLPTSLEKQVAELFFKNKQPSLKNTELILIESTHDLYYLSIFGAISISLSKIDSYKFEQFLCNSLSVGESASLLTFITYRILNLLSNLKWAKLHNSFCDGIGFKSSGLKNPLHDISDIWDSYKCWKNITSKDILNALTYDGILIGDLINDSYLRFKPAPTVNLKDLYLLIVIFQAYRDVRSAKNYFNKKKPSLFLTSYSTYIQHGIAARVALQLGIHVFTFGNRQEFFKKLSLDDWFHTKFTRRYAEEFKNLPNTSEKLKLSESALNSRVSGALDNATSYMKQSAYKQVENNVPNVKGAVIVFLHDFYDSPHIFANMVFSDFWEWACFTIDALYEENINFYIKPHPNQIDLNDGVLKQLKTKYPRLNILPNTITNKQLVDGGIISGITVYGTVAHELAFMGIPSIACASHPHISFDFCDTAKSKSEYYQLLKQSNKMLSKKETIKKQSLIFYYMHNLHLDDQSQLIMNQILKIKRLINSNTNNVLLFNAIEEFINLESLSKLTTTLNDW